MAFKFLEHFSVEFPEMIESDIKISEAFSSSNGIIIEVAAIHERFNFKL
jgi:hypothetical protein